MNKETVKRYFRRSFRHQASAKRKIGLEMEFPIVTNDGYAPSLGEVLPVFDYLQSLGFDVKRDTGTGAPIAAYGSFLGDAKAVDKVELELGYCVLEIAIRPTETIFDAAEVLSTALKKISNFFRKANLEIIGYGIQPIASPGRALQSPKARYNVYEKISKSKYLKAEVGRDIHLFTIAAASQCHVDIEFEEIPRALNVLNALAGVFVSLSANSSVWQGRVDPEWLAPREMFYDKGMNPWPERIGNSREYSDAYEYLNDILASKPLVVARNSDFAIVRDCTTVMDFFGHSSATLETPDGTVFATCPRIDDLLLFSNVWWPNARVSLGHGTIEARAFCQQPPMDLFAPAALVLGLLEGLEDAEQIVFSKPWRDWIALRSSAAANGLRGIDTGLVRDVLGIAEDGLKRRGFSEESMLQPFQDNVKSVMTPADRAAEIFRSNGISALIRSCRLGD